MSEKKKNIGDSKLLGGPNKMLGLRLKNGAVTNEKLAPNSITRDKLSELLKALLRKFEEDIAALQLATGETADPEVIKEMIRDIIQEMIDDGDDIIDVNALIETIISRIDVGDTAILPIDGIAPVGTDIDVIERQVAEGTEGEILYYPSEKTFVFRVTNELDPEQVTPETFSYYRYWPGFEPYTDFTQGVNNGKPKPKVFFVLRDGSAYYYWDGTTMQELATQELVSNIVASKTEIVGTNGVSVIETINPTTNKKTQTASLANISYNNGVNEVGTSYVFGNSLPSLSAHTKYVIANNVNNNNNPITLPSGSKIVPNGGIPTVPVEGGELSWVHSSDIGMIQATDAERESGNYNLANGNTNRDILRAVLKSRYNLILDGYYYINFDSYPSEATGVVDYNDNYAIKVDRDFSIQNGGLIVDSSLFYITAGKFSASNVSFHHNRGYGLLLLDCRKNYIDALILNNCNFSGGHRAILASGADCMPSRLTGIGTVRWTPSFVKTYKNYYREKYSSTSEEDFSIVSIYEDNYANLAVYVDHATTAGIETTLVEKHPARGVMYYPTDNGTHKFVIKQNGSEVHDTQEGYFTTIETIIPESEGVEKKDSGGNVIAYSTVEFEDTCDLQGIGTVKITGCSFDTATITMGDITVVDEFSIRGCSFFNIEAAPISFGTTNTFSFANDWNGASCPIVIENSIFKGKHSFEKSTQNTYVAACLAEVGKFYFRNNIVEDLLGKGANVYDLYVSSNEIYVENNIFRNILPAAKIYGSRVVSTDTNILHRQLSGICKFKSLVVGSEAEEYYALNGALPFKAIRVYKNNKYIVNPAEIHDWVIESLRNMYDAEGVKELLAVNHDELIVNNEIDYETMFERYTLKTGFCGIVAHYPMDEVIIENNEFDLKGCYIITDASTGTKNMVKRLSFKNNIIKAKQFSSANEDYTSNLSYVIKQIYSTNNRFRVSANHSLLAVNAQSGNVKVDISNNHFVADVKARINILGIASMYNSKDNEYISIDSLYVENNIFENCDFRIVGCYSPRNLGVGEGDNCYGEVYADTLYIRNNKVAADCDTNYTTEFGLSGRSMDNNAGATMYYGSRENCTTVPSKFRYNKGIVDIETTQSSPCYYPMIFLGPNDDAELIIRSKKIIRPSSSAVFNDNTQKAVADGVTYMSMWTKDESRVYYNNYSLDVHIPIPIFPSDGRSHEPHYSFTVEYTKGGSKHTKRIEAGIQNDVRTDDVAPSNAWVNGIWRTCEGQRMSYKAYNSSSKMYAYKDYIDDIGLYYMIIFCSQNYAGNRMALHVSFFTDINGTTNDNGSDIIIRVNKIPKHDDIKDAGTAAINFDYNNINTTSIKEFVPEGSLKSSTWRNLTNEFGNGTSTAVSYVRNSTLTPILAPSDKGFWVRDSETLRKYTWSGTAWIPETLVVTMSQVEYDALTNVDENTLYIIQNPTT